MAGDSGCLGSTARVVRKGALFHTFSRVLRATVKGRLVVGMWGMHAGRACPLSAAYGLVLGPAIAARERALNRAT